MINNENVKARLTIEIEGEKTTLICTRAVVNGARGFAVEVEGGTLPSGDERREFATQPEAMTEFHRQCRLVVETAEEATEDESHESTAEKLAAISGHIRANANELALLIPSACFALETVAHLRGMERELLPMTDRMRAILKGTAVAS